MHAMTWHGIGWRLPPLPPPPTHCFIRLYVYLGIQELKSPCSEFASRPYKIVSSCHCRRGGGEAATATCFRHGSKDLVHMDSSNENLFMDGRQKSKRRKYSMSQYIVFLRFNVLCVCPSFSTVSSITVALKIGKTRRRAER